MNLLDNGDGTYTDLDTGDTTDVFGNVINAVPNATVLEYANQPGITSGGQVDTSVAPAAVVRDNGGNGFLSGADAFFNSIESGLTNLYTPLVNAGIVQTPAQVLAAQQAQSTATLQQQQAAQQFTLDADTKKYLLVGGIALLILLAIRTGAK